MHSTKPEQAAQWAIDYADEMTKRYTHRPVTIKAIADTVGTTVRVECNLCHETAAGARFPEFMDYHYCPGTRESELLSQSRTSIELIARTALVRIEERDESKREALFGAAFSVYQSATELLRKANAREVKLSTDDFDAWLTTRSVAERILSGDGPVPGEERTCRPVAANKLDELRREQRAIQDQIAARS